MGLDIFLLNEKEEQLADFRKINFVMGWLCRTFETNPEEVNLKPILLSKEKLNDLIDKTETIINAKSNSDDWKEIAKSTLPIYEGFFFGSYEYDDYYYGRIRFVHNSLKNIINTEQDIRIVCWW